MTRDHGWWGGRGAAQRWGAWARPRFLPAHRSPAPPRGCWSTAVGSVGSARRRTRSSPCAWSRWAFHCRRRRVGPSALAFRQRWRIPPAALLLGSFGFQTPIKRTDVAICALASRGLENVHLLIAGELSPYSNYAALAAELGVADRVHVTGFLPFEQLDARDLGRPISVSTCATRPPAKPRPRSCAFSLAGVRWWCPITPISAICPRTSRSISLPARARCRSSPRRWRSCSTTVPGSHGWARRRVATWPSTLPSVPRMSWSRRHGARASCAARRSPAAAGSAHHGGAKAGAGPDRRPRLRRLVARRASQARGRGRQRQPDPLVAEPGAAGRGHLRGAVPLRGARPLSRTALAVACRKRSNRGRRGASSSSCAVPKRRPAC